jgi:hypothetical protein
MGRVFVVQQPMRKIGQDDIDRGLYRQESLGDFVPRFDLTPAAEHGEVILLLDSGAPVGIAATPMIHSFAEKMQGYCDDDCILPTGSPVAMSLAVTVAAQYNNGVVNTLVWDRRQRKYIKVTTPPFEKWRIKTH